MHTLKLIGALTIVVALSAIVVVGTATAAETPWQWLPGSVGETFSGKSGTIELQQKGGGTFDCTSATILLTDEAKKVSSELTEGTESKDAKGALLVVHITGCKALGFGFNSDGDPKETILAHYEIKGCMITKAEKRFGWLFKLLPIHVEVPTVKQLFTMEGAFVAEIKATATKLVFALAIEQKEGKQVIEKCEGGEAETLKLKLGTGENLQSGVGVSGPEITFDMTKDKEGETMMEK